MKKNILLFFVILLFSCNNSKITTYNQYLLFYKNDIGNITEFLFDEYIKNKPNGGVEYKRNLKSSESLVEVGIKVLYSPNDIPKDIFENKIIKKLSNIDIKNKLLSFYELKDNSYKRKEDIDNNDIEIITDILNFVSYDAFAKFFKNDNMSVHYSDENIILHNLVFYPAYYYNPKYDVPEKEYEVKYNRGQFYRTLGKGVMILKTSPVQEKKVIVLKVIKQVDDIILSLLFTFIAPN